MAVPPRARSELAAEALGLLSFALLIPAAVLVHATDFVSLRYTAGWLGLGVAIASLCLYAWPHTWPASLAGRSRRVLWWGIPFFPALLALAFGIQIRHPYLDFTRSDRAKLAAERVLTLESNVVAGRHADWVFDYAESLAKDDPEQAARLYGEGLRLDPTNEAAQARLASLAHAGAADPAAGALRGGGSAASERARRPLWTPADPTPRLLRCRIDAGLEAVDRTGVVLVPVGDVADSLLDVVGGVLQEELALPTCVAQGVSLPPHTRVRGLVFGRQWSQVSLVKAFVQQIGALPRSPMAYVLLTPADIYSEDTNFVFSGSYSWGALVSVARYGDPARQGDPVLLHRTAKQVLGSLITSFGVPRSTDRGCVTSYTKSIPEFDAKGNRPNDESLARFQSVIADRDRAWADFKRNSLQAGGSTP
jgi:predicted Zn-dependent protease